MRDPAPIKRAKERHNASGKPLLAANKRRAGMQFVVYTAEQLAARYEKLAEEFTEAPKETP